MQLGTLKRKIESLLFLVSIVIFCGCADSGDSESPWGPSQCYTDSNAKISSNDPVDWRMSLFTFFSFGSFKEKATILSPGQLRDRTIFHFDQSIPFGPGASSYREEASIDISFPSVDLSNLRVIVAEKFGIAHNSGIDAGPVATSAVRNLEGELLFAFYDDGFNDENRVSEVIPEISIEPNERIETTTIKCTNIDSEDTYEIYSLRIKTNVDSIVLKPGEKRIIKIGCVEYFFTLGTVLKRMTNNCWNKSSIRRFYIMRKSLHDPKAESPS